MTELELRHAHQMSETCRALIMATLPEMLNLSCAPQYKCLLPGSHWCAYACGEVSGWLCNCGKQQVHQPFFLRVKCRTVAGLRLQNHHLRLRLHPSII